VFAVFSALLSALFVAVWLALLFPLVIEPPAMFTGTLALTAFWLASASELAAWFVVAD
jgi:hypothetical protein